VCSSVDRADEDDPGKLEAVTQPPAEVGVVEQKRGRQRRGQPGDADDDGQIRDPTREKVRLERPQDEHRVEDHAEHERRQGEDCAADGQCCRPGQVDHAVPADDDARRRQAVDREQGGHHGERRADEDDAPVAAADADDGQRDGCEGGRDRADADADEVDVGAEVGRVVSQEMEPDARRDGACADERDERDEPVAKKEPHRVVIGRAAPHVEGPAT
jgi:hypothetical protein